MMRIRYDFRSASSEPLTPFSDISSRSANTYRDGKYSRKVQRPLASQLDDRTFSAGFVVARLHVTGRYSETIQQLKRNDGDRFKKKKTENIKRDFLPLNRIILTCTYVQHLIAFVGRYPGVHRVEFVEHVADYLTEYQVQHQRTGHRFFGGKNLREKNEKKKT